MQGQVSTTKKKMNLIQKFHEGFSDNVIQNTFVEIMKIQTFKSPCNFRGLFVKNEVT